MKAARLPLSDAQYIVVPGTGVDPVTSCFSDTLEETIDTICEASGSAESQNHRSGLGAFMRPKIGPNISKYISALLRRIISSIAKRGSLSDPLPAAAGSSRAMWPYIHTLQR